ncbi:hypothetical protein [Micromonospora sp. NPDC092111]|uniref:hypothetical protein n=1 Tax=Micromonospora sp. NPDC092111 TaxID=3364289 RepID=UPI003816E1E3
MDRNSPGDDAQTASRCRSTGAPGTPHAYTRLTFLGLRVEAARPITRSSAGQAQRHNTLELDRGVGCPYRTDAEWSRLRRDDPAGWEDAVAFDAAIRHGSARANAAGQQLRGQFFLHRQRVPLEQVTLRPRAEAGLDAPGCGPWTCPHTDPPAGEAGDAAATPGREVRH